MSRLAGALLTQALRVALTELESAGGAGVLALRDPQIATQAGYATEFSFSKAFKRTFGVAPGAYRGQPNQVPGLSPSRRR